MPRRKRSPKSDRRRALELLAASRDGCTEAIMMVHGFSMYMLSSSSTPGSRPRIVAGSRPMEIIRA
jgi:hypothetical protein